MRLLEVWKGWQGTPGGGRPLRRQLVDVSRILGGLGGEGVVCGGSKGKFCPPEGKFKDRPYDMVGRERRKDVCQICTWTCCAAMWHLIKCLIDIGELRADTKVRVLVLV